MSAPSVPSPRRSYSDALWSPTSKRRYNNRVFTDSTEKAAVDEFDKKYVETNKPRDAIDFAALLMMIHKQKNPASVVINVYRIPPNTTGWLQPCDIVLFGPTKQKVRKQI